MASLADRSIAHVLEGTWHLRASNLPVWLSGERGLPTIIFELLSEEPLVLIEDVSYPGPDGDEVHSIGTDRWEDGEFSLRGKGVRRLLPSRWAVDAVSDDETLVVARFEESWQTPAGINILERDGAHTPRLRAVVAHATEDFGLSPEDFASLAWFTNSSAVL